MLAPLDEAIHHVFNHFYIQKKSNMKLHNCDPNLDEQSPTPGRRNCPVTHDISLNTQIWHSHGRAKERQQADNALLWRKQPEK